jgi:hypothetical protein
VSLPLGKNQFAVKVNNKNKSFAVLPVILKEEDDIKLLFQ